VLTSLVKPASSGDVGMVILSTGMTLRLLLNNMSNSDHSILKIGRASFGVNERSARHTGDFARWLS